MPALIPGLFSKESPDQRYDRTRIDLQNRGHGPAIGTRQVRCPFYDLAVDYKALLTRFWQLLSGCRQDRPKLSQHCPDPGVTPILAYMLGRAAPQPFYNMVRLDFDNTVSFCPIGRIRKGLQPSKITTTMVVVGSISQIGTAITWK
jgi:hypothetical protein